jgi:hypothetical protein
MIERFQASIVRRENAGAVGGDQQNWKMML